MASLHPQPGEASLLLHLLRSLFLLNMACDRKDLKSLVWTFITIANSNATNTKRFENLKSLRGLHWRLTFWIIQRFPDFSQMNQRWYYSIFNTEKRTLFLLVSWIRFVNDLTTLKYGWMSNESAAHDHDLYFMKIKKKYLKNWNKQISISWKWRKK